LFAKVASTRAAARITASGRLFAIDAGYWLVFYVAMGLVFLLVGH
jgi:hypothetical protein